MSGGEIALDTNAAIAVLNDTDGTGSWARGFERLHLPLPVIGELRFGALNSTRVESNLACIDQLVARCHVIPITLATASVYALIRVELKRRGRPIPENDLWIAASCVESGLPLASDDAHFREIAGLQVLQR